ncbi:PaaI family thioesterase [Saccharopolyspora taberi]|uniref:PaaI family thioesterase n=1 Tax=Saccharopolyspora taberi TaxID=60895 RepID=A0ABN3V271_9PSEU
MSVDATADTAVRLRAIRELGAVLRELNEAAVSTEVDTETLVRVAEEARKLVAPLEAAQRTRHELPTVDVLGQGRRRMYNPAVGPGSPIAPPMRVEVGDDGTVVGSCTLGLAFEGPPSYGHGGISALLLDQLLGHVHAARGRPGMTIKLSLRYRRPVPLQTPLRLTGWPDRQVAPGGCRATIATEAEPEEPLVEATGVFVSPSPEQVQALFGDTSAFSRGTRRD